MTLVLYGGEDVKKRNCEHIQRKHVQKGDNVLIIHWTTRNKEDKYRNIMKYYYTDLGANVEFLEREDNKKLVKRRIELANIIYLHGGNTDLLLESLKKTIFLDRFIQKLQWCFNG